MANTQVSYRQSKLQFVKSGLSAEEFQETLRNLDKAIAESRKIRTTMSSGSDQTCETGRILGLIQAKNILMDTK
jgi:hypothetical protein